MRGSKVLHARTVLWLCSTASNCLLSSQLHSGFVELKPVAAVQQQGAHLRWHDPVGDGEPFESDRFAFSS
jgi:hypothetical protein